MPKVYQIIDWPKHFENSNSVRVKNAKYWPCPVKQGVGYKRLRKFPRGLELYALWCLVVSKCMTQFPRSGWLTEGGKETDKPWDAEYLATYCDADPALVQQMLDAVCSAEVGWMRFRVYADGEETGPTWKPPPGQPPTLFETSTGEKKPVPIKQEELQEHGPVEKPRERKKTVVATEKFDTFWNAYPKIRRDARTKCFDKWKSLDLEPIADEVLAGLRRWINSEEWQKSDGQFVKSTLAWLNQRKWEAHPKQMIQERLPTADEAAEMVRDAHAEQAAYKKHREQQREKGADLEAIGFKNELLSLPKLNRPAPVKLTGTETIEPEPVMEDDE